jgi:hypothetical protein
MRGMPVALDADGPGRAARDLQRQARRQARRLHQAAARLPLAPGGGGHVDRQDQRVKPRIPRAGQHVGADAGIARRVHLEPALIALRAAEVLGRARGHGGQAIGNARLRGVARQQTFRLGPDQPGHPHRRDAEGHGIVAAQECRASSGVISPRSAAGRNSTRSSAARLRGRTLSLPVALSKNSQTKCGMRCLARALRSEIAGYRACWSIGARKTPAPRLVQPRTADPFIFPQIRKSTTGQRALRNNLRTNL